MKLTPRQREVLNAITAFVSERGFPPTDRELAERIGVKPKTARHFVELFERKGIVRQPRGPDGRALARTLTVIVRPA